MFRSGLRFLGNSTTLIALLGVWQLLSAFDLMSATFPDPLGVAIAWFEMLVSGTLGKDVVGSLLRVLAGFGLALLLATGSAAVVSIIPGAARQFRPLVELLRPIPPIAWIPIAILWFGIGNGPAVFVVAVGAFFPVFVGTHDAINLVPAPFIKTAQCLGASRQLIFWDVLLPSALPTVLSGWRVGLGVAWTSVIAAELIGAQSGLGYMIQLNRLLLQTDNVVAGMATIGLLGYLMTWVFDLLTNLLFPWASEKPPEEGRSSQPRPIKNHR